MPCPHATPGRILLQAGYAVVFLTRTGSIQPFTQDLPLTESVPLLQSLIDLGGSKSSSSAEGISCSLRAPAAERVAAILRKVQDVQQSHLLLTIPFTTIFEYLQVRAAIAGVVQLAASTTAAWGGGMPSAVVALLRTRVKHNCTS